MAGPVFRFEYPPGAAPDREQLAAIAAKVAGPIIVDARGEIALAVRRRHVGSMFVSVATSRLAAGLQGFERDAFAAQLGWIPGRTVTGYAMANGEAEARLLRAVARVIVDAHGGFAITERPPHFGRERARVVEARDLRGYFGLFADDPEYVRANLDQVVPVLYWVVDVRGCAPEWVGK